MTQDLRVWVVGTGTVGRWLLRAFQLHAALLERRYGLAPKVVGLANRSGFVHDPSGIALEPALGRLASGGSLMELPGVGTWPTALEGLEATDADLLVEVTASPLTDAEPGISHMREALRRRIPVVTSNKWPVALHGVELAAVAREQRVEFRAESTVMSGTPVVGPLVHGLAGTRPVRLRGALNATANAVLTEMEDGRTYADALALAQDVGLAERDPSADVDGYDSLAKTMILGALVFGEQLAVDDVPRTGIADVTLDDVVRARAHGARIRLVSTIELSDAGIAAGVEPARLPVDDVLARVTGATNAVVCEAAPVGEVTIVGPGAGPELAGQGVFGDLIAVGRGLGLVATRPVARW